MMLPTLCWPRHWALDWLHVIGDSALLLVIRLRSRCFDTCAQWFEFFCGATLLTFVERSYRCDCVWRPRDPAKTNLFTAPFGFGAEGNPWKLLITVHRQVGAAAPLKSSGTASSFVTANSDYRCRPHREQFKYRNRRHF